MKKILAIQNCRTEGFGVFLECLFKKGIACRVFPAYAKRTNFPQDDFGAVLIGGTPISVREIESHDFLKRERDFVAAAVKKGQPLFGICFGGQIIAHALGAKVGKNPVMEIGGYDIELTGEGLSDRFFRGFPAMFPVFHWHGDTFDTPAGASLLAKGKDCPNQAFRYESSLVLQFHLEVTALEAARWAAVYRDEPSLVNKTSGEIIRECREREGAMRKLAWQLMENFLEG